MNAPIDLQGRACRRCALVRRYFGELVEGAERDPQAFQPFELLSAQKWTDPKSCAPRLWLVGADATEITRAPDAPVGPVSPQDFYQFAGAVAGGVRTQNSSVAKVQVTINNMGGQHVFWMDANQGIELYSDSVTLDLILPANFVDAAREPTAERGPGLVADIEIGGYFFEIEQSKGMREVRYTTYHPVAAGTQAVIQVPPFAQSCTVYQNGQGAASTEWTMHVGEPPGSVGVGTVPFIPAARKSEPGIELASATHLASDTDPAAFRFFTIAWTIRP